MIQLSLPGIRPDYRERRYRRYLSLNNCHFRARHVFHFSRAIRLSTAINRLCRVGVRGKWILRIQDRLPGGHA
jgi:hypothetical protein